MKFANKPRLFVAFLCLFTATAFAQESGTGPAAPLKPKLITPIQAIMPMSLHNTNIQNPKVVARIQVSGNGMVEDLVILEASHINLIDRAESLIRKALFDPGDVRLNEAIRFELILPFLYPSDLGMPNKTTVDDIEIMIDEVKDEDLSVRFHKPGELDETPRLLERGEIYVPQDEDGEPVPGEAKVEFYVNHKGEVRLPRVLSSTDDEMAIAALATVKDMKFLPPTVNGNPAVTQVRMPYSTKP